MTQPAMTRTKRRRTVRRSVPMEALIGQKRARPIECDNAFVDSMNDQHARIRSAKPLREKDSCVIYVGEKQYPYHSKVLSVRKNGLIVTRRMGKAGPAYVAECKLSEYQAPVDVGAAVHKAGRVALTAFLDGLPAMVRWGIYALGLGVVAGAVYALLAIVALFR